MNLVQVLLLTVAVLGSATLTVLASLVPGRPILRRSFIVCVALLTVEPLISFWLALDPRVALAEPLWRAILPLRLAAALTWGLFLTALAAEHHPPGAHRWRVARGAAALAPLVTASLVLFFNPFLREGSRPDSRALSPVGLTLGLVELGLITILLASLELLFRSAGSEARWRIKHLLLGLCVIFASRLYSITHAILFNQIQLMPFAAQAASLPTAHALMAVSLLRGALATERLRVSRMLLSRCITALAVGTYLFGAGASGWLLSTIEAHELAFWVVPGLLLVAAAASVFALSEEFRRRLRRAAATYLYSQKYDYRDQWILFSQRLGAPVTLPELSERLLDSASTALSATSAALYLIPDTGSGPYELVSSLGSTRWPKIIDSAHILLSVVARPPWQARLFPSAAAAGDEMPCGTDALPWPLLAAPLVWQSSPVGLLLLGPGRDGTPYDTEDLTLVTTMAQQAASAVVSLTVAERAARGREFEALHRLTSFIMHDLKSSFSALALLVRNAESRLGDPDFQRDALRTLNRTVERISRLLSRLSPAALSIAEVRTPVDLRSVLERVAKDVPRDECLELHRILEPVPEILGDPEALERVIRGLVDNALDAMERKGTLTLRTAWYPPWVECTVSDTGCGMTQKFMEESLFRPFRSTKKDGWGLGLYHTYEVVSSHHGRIEVQSEPGKGTTVTLRFPPVSPNPRPAT